MERWWVDLDRIYRVHALGGNAVTGYYHAQGTFWREERTWSAYDFHIIQSGESQEYRLYAGIITIISSKLCSKDAIAFSAPIPGRLLHMRCCPGDKALDMINVYQQTAIPNPHRPKPMQSRAALWTKMDQLLAGLTIRKLEILGGNCNYTLPGHGQHKLLLKNEQDFQELIKKHLYNSVKIQDKGPIFINT